MGSRRPKGILKATPECFVVQELTGPNATPVPLHSETAIYGPNGTAPVTIFHLVKRDVSTDDAMREVARQLRVNHEAVTNHGLKDRHAVTAQNVGVYGDFQPTFSHTHMTLRQVRTADRPLSPGGHRGNRFNILILSDVKEIDVSRLNEVPNVFGHQRFGTPMGYEVGRLLLEGNFTKAADVERRYGSGLIDRIGSRVGSWEEAFFAPAFLRETEFRIMQWQSHLWNTLLQKVNYLPERLPMWSLENRRTYEFLWSPERLEPRALKLLHPFVRKTTIQPKNLTVEREPMGWRFRFDLPPGAYATVVLSQVFDLQEKHRRT